MPIIRNPFRRAPGEHAADENVKPTGIGGFTAGGLLGRRTESDPLNGKPMVVEMPQEAPEYKMCGMPLHLVHIPVPCR